MQLLPLLRLSHTWLGARNGASHPSERGQSRRVVGRHDLVLSKVPLLKISSSILNLMSMGDACVALGSRSRSRLRRPWWSSDSSPILGVPLYSSIPSGNLLTHLSIGIMKKKYQKSKIDEKTQLVKKPVTLSPMVACRRRG